MSTVFGLSAEPDPHTLRVLAPVARGPERPNPVGAGEAPVQRQPRGARDAPSCLGWGRVYSFDYLEDHDEYRDDAGERSAQLLRELSRLVLPHVACNDTGAQRPGSGGGAGRIEFTGVANSALSGDDALSILKGSDVDHGRATRCTPRTFPPLLLALEPLLVVLAVLLGHVCRWTGPASPRHPAAGGARPGRGPGERHAGQGGSTRDEFALSSLLQVRLRFWISTDARTARHLSTAVLTPTGPTRDIPRHSTSTMA